MCALSDLLQSLSLHGLRPGTCTGDEMRDAASRLHNSLSTLGVGTPSSVPKPHADDPFAMAADWGGPHVVPRRLDEYPLYGISFLETHLPVVSPRGVAMLHCTFLCATCADAHAAGSFDPSCYIHSLAHMLMGVRCTWGPEGPPIVSSSAQRPASHAERTADEAAWLDAEHDRMVADGKAETLTPSQAADPEECALIAPIRVAYRIGAIGDPPDSASVPALADAARAAASVAAARISAGGAPPAAQAAKLAADLATHGGVRKPRFVMGCHRTINRFTPPKGLTFPTIFDAVAGAPPGCLMRGSDGKAAFYQLPIHADHLKYFCYELPSGRIGRNRRCCFGGNAAPSAEAFLTAELKSVLRGGYPPGSRGGGERSPAINTAPDVGRGDLTRPPTVTSMHAARRAALVRGEPPDAAPDGCYLIGGILDDILEVVAADKSAETVSWSKGVLRYASVTANVDKDFISAEPDALGAHIVLAHGSSPTTVSPKSEKLRATLAHAYLWEALASLPGGWRVPFKWLESFNGSVGWLAQFYRRIRLIRRPIGALVYQAQAAGARDVLLTKDSPASLAVRKIIALAEGNALRPTVFFRAGTLSAASLAVASSGSPRSEEDSALYAQFARALQALGGTRASASADGLLAVASSSSDGSVDASGAAWGAVFDDGSGPCALHGLVLRPGAHSDEVELAPLSEIAESKFHLLPPGAVFTFRSDNLGNCYRINKARCSPDSPCFSMLDRIFELADANAIELLALWCPRAVNSALDSLASLRSDREVDAWCAAHGVALY